MVYLFGKSASKELSEIRNVLILNAFFGPVTISIYTLTYRCALIFAVSIVTVIPAIAQQDPLDPREKQSPGGLELVLTNSGFGLGGYLRDSVNTRFTFIGEVRITTGKDEREVAFFDRFGRRTIPGKANYLLMAPISAGSQMRIFANRIEDSFRPFIQVSGGPTLGWEYPYFEDCNDNGIFEIEVDCNGDDVIDEDEGERRLGSLDALPEGRMRVGAGGALGAGAYFGYSKRGVLGIRIEYSFTYFVKGIQLLEQSIKKRQHFFATPTVTIFFGPIF